MSDEIAKSITQDVEFSNGERITVFDYKRKIDTTNPDYPYRYNVRIINIGDNTHIHLCICVKTSKVITVGGDHFTCSPETFTIANIYLLTLTSAYKEELRTKSNKA